MREIKTRERYKRTHLKLDKARVVNRHLRRDTAAIKKIQTPDNREERNPENYAEDNVSAVTGTVINHVPYEAAKLSRTGARVIKTRARTAKEIMHYETPVKVVNEVTPVESAGIQRTIKSRTVNEKVNTKKQSPREKNIKSDTKEKSTDNMHSRTNTERKHMPITRSSERVTVRSADIPTVNSTGSIRNSHKVPAFEADDNRNVRVRTTRVRIKDRGNIRLKSKTYLNVPESKTFGREQRVYTNTVSKPTTSKILSKRKLQTIRKIGVKRLVENRINSRIVTIEPGKITRKIAEALTRKTKALIESGLTKLIALGGAGTFAVIVIIICILFGAAFNNFGDESSVGYTQVSPEVEAYSEVIQKYANEYGIGEYTELVKAVMMQESGGKGTDPTQCSECGLNTKYPHSPNSIKSAEYSIDVGTHYLANLLKKANCESPLDMDHIRLALQSYNYGSGYLDWAVNRDGGYTVENAVVFSDEQAEKKGWSSYGDKSYVSNVLRYYPYGNYNMGVGNTAITQVAAEQIGNSGGRKFWSWYGFKNHVEWCACFVSWCGDQCGYIKAGIIPKFASVFDGINWFKERGQWQNSTYTPASGDIIFFDWEGDRLADHVGLVEKVEDGYVWTIEGNSGDKCRELKYDVGSSWIYGYGVPKY